MNKSKNTSAKNKTLSKDDKIKNPLAPKNVEIIDNPLASAQTTNALTVSPSQEIERKVEIVEEIESLATITKQQLSIRQQRVELEVENKKLDAAKKTISTVNKIMDVVLNEDVIEKLSDSIKKPSDLKMMAEAAEKLTNTLKNLMNSNIADEFGNKKKYKIDLLFKTSGAVQGAIQIDNSGDD